MKVFVTGASGFVGTEIVRRLQRLGHSVRVLDRHAGTSRRIQALGLVETKQGDVLDAHSLSGSMDGIDAVVHLVGIISEYRASTYESVHVLGTRNMLSAARAARVSRFIHMSALGTRPGAVSRYHQSKWAAEESVRNSGLDYTIFRPSLIYGPGDRFVNLFARIIRLSPVVPVLGSGSALSQPISLENVAECFAKAVTERRSIGQCFDLCGPERLTFDEILDCILEVMERKRWKLHIPLTFARAQAVFLEWVYPHLSRKPPPLNRDQLIMLQEGNVGDPALADGLFDLKEVPFRQGIARYLAPVAPPHSPGALRMGKA